MPMHWACHQGKLDFVKWLFKVGAAEDIRDEDDDGLTPLKRAYTKAKIEVVTWVILEGGANNEDGHFGPSRLRHDDDCNDKIDEQLLQSLEEESLLRTTFVSTVLNGISFEGSVSAHETKRPGQRSRPGRPRPLCLLRGHHESIVLVIADFVGVPRGRCLRNLQEALSFLQEELSPMPPSS